MPAGQVSTDTGLQEVAPRLVPGAPLGAQLPPPPHVLESRIPGPRAGCALPPCGAGLPGVLWERWPTSGSSRATRVGSSGLEERQTSPAVALAPPARQPTAGRARHAAPGPRVPRPHTRPAPHTPRGGPPRTLVSLGPSLG